MPTTTSSQFDLPITDQMSRLSRGPQSPDNIQVFCSQCAHNISKVTVTEVRLCPHCSSPTFVNAAVERLGVTAFPSPPSETSHYSDRRRGIDMHDANSDRRLRLCGAAGCPFATANSHDVLTHLIESHRHAIWERYTALTAYGILY